jgi:hypothetical protein
MSLRLMPLCHTSDLAPMFATGMSPMRWSERTPAVPMQRDSLSNQTLCVFGWTLRQVQRLNVCGGGHRRVHIRHPASRQGPPRACGSVTTVAKTNSRHVSRPVATSDQAQRQPAISPEIRNASRRLSPCLNFFRLF